MPDDKKLLEAKIQSVRKQIAGLDTKRSALASLLDKLEKQYEQPGSPRVAESKPDYTVGAGTDENVRLFLSLFRGREDVFPKRWESRTGRSGYSPTCKNEWVRGVCGKPRTKCAECESREFVPLTEEVIRKHLTGQLAIGVYPLLRDETCHFLAVDFDKKDWMDDASAFVETCRKKEVFCAVEKSRSGKGAHVWFFFEKSIPARLARRFGCALLTETMEKRHQIGLDSYDRFFPSQDTMPKGGFGNLIALPLQAEPAKEGNSLFVDSDFKPYPDQWQFLRSIKRISEQCVRSIEEEAARKGRILGVRMTIDDASDQPWMLPPSGRRSLPAIQGPIPSRVKVVFSNFLYVEKESLPSGLVNRIIRLAAFQNPDFYQAQAMRLSTFGKPRIISCAEEFEKHIAVPRGCSEDLSALFKDLNIQMSVQDKRVEGQPIEVNFTGELSQEQQESVAALLANEIGVLAAPAAFGKTVVGAKLIADRKVNTLVLVHRQQLLDQWRARLAAFLNVDEKSIGQIGAGKKRRTGFIDVGMLQSLSWKHTVDDLVAEYGHVIVDECHRVSAPTFELVLRQVKAKFVMGLTATPIRRDGHHPIIFMQCGLIRFGFSPKKAAQQRKFEHKVITRNTNTEVTLPEDRTKIHDAYDAIIQDNHRTEMIVGDVKEALQAGKSPLILTERRQHLQILAEKLTDMAADVFVLHGGIRQKQRGEVMEKFRSVPERAPRVLLATGKYIGEGFDDARLDTLFLTMPVSWRGILQQYAGRLHRAHHAKKEVVIYDYVDVKIPMATRMFERRKRGYAALGYGLIDGSQPDLDLYQ